MDRTFLVLSLIKDSALAGVVGYVEYMRSTQILITRTHETWLLLLGAGLLYFIICYPVSRYSRRLGEKDRRMIEIKNVRKTFGQLDVLKGINLDVNKGELLCLLGASGSGKSTLLQCINGLEPIQGGEIIVDGVSVHHPNTNINTLRRKLGIVFQQYNAFPHLTALENVALCPRVVAKRTRKEARVLAHKHLDHVGLGDKADSLPSQMSGGQQQRVAIARALAMEPSYMLFDRSYFRT